MNNTEMELREALDAANKLIGETAEESRRIVDALRAELNVVTDRLRLLNEDAAEQDTQVRNLLSPILGDKVVDGDSYGVPGLGDLVEMLVARLDKVRSVLVQIEAHPTHEDIIEGEFCDFGHNTLAREALLALSGPVPWPEGKPVLQTGAGPAPEEIKPVVGHCDVPDCDYYGPVTVILQRGIAGLYICPEHAKERHE